MDDTGDDLQDRLAELLGTRDDVLVALLFGSRATGAATPASDVDLAVLAPGVDRYALWSELSDSLQLDVDLIDLEQAGVPLLDEILRHGVVVHEHRPGAAALWRSRTLALLEVDRPWYRRMRDAWLARVAEQGL